MCRKQASELLDVFAVIWLKFLVMSDSRKEVVKALRALARTHGVVQVRDDASRDKVLGMVKSLRAKTLDQAQRRSLEESVTKYPQTFPDYVNTQSGNASAAPGRFASVVCNLVARLIWKMFRMPQLWCPW